MLKIYDAENHLDAQLAMDTLQSAGLEVVMKGQFLSGAAGELPPTGLITLWLCEPAHEQQARSLVAEYETRKNHVAPPQKCPACDEMIEGNFVCCWSCGAQLPDTFKSF